VERRKQKQYNPPVTTGTTTEATPEALSNQPDEACAAGGNKWCRDRKILERRTKEIAKAKDSDVYRLYLSAVPKSRRMEDRGVHPRTPNKWLNCSRRGWDGQVRSWKKSLYTWANSQQVPSNFANSRDETA